MIGDEHVRYERVVLCKGLDLEGEDALSCSIEAKVLVAHEKVSPPIKNLVDCVYLCQKDRCEAMAYESQIGWEGRLPKCIYKCSKPKNA